MAVLHCYEHHRPLAMLASPAICCYPENIDRHSDDYVTMFHLAGCLWRTRSHALVIQTMGLHGLLCACS